MPKVTLNGTTGLTAYKADNTTVEVQYTPAQLVGINPSAFTSASPLVISGLAIDASSDPSSLVFNDSTKFELLSYEVDYITSSSEQYSPNDTTHLFPTGIQAGDILVMLQFNRMKTAPGYGPTYGSGWGTGFTPAPGSINNAITQQATNYYASGYDITDTYVSYKVATGSESGANIDGFQGIANPNGTNGGWRRLMVFRPSFAVSSLTSSLDAYTSPFAVTEYVDTHTASLTKDISGTNPRIVVSFHIAYSNVAGPSVSGDFSSLSNVETYNYAGIATYVHTGAVTSGPAENSITLTGQSTNSPEVLHMFTIELAP